MISTPLFALALAQSAPATLPKPLTDIHKRDLSCVAALAIVASEQERGVASSFEYPLLEERDPHHYDLCDRHAGRLNPPQGWQLRDRRVWEPPAATSLIAV